MTPREKLEQLKKPTAKSEIKYTHINNLGKFYINRVILYIGIL